MTNVKERAAQLADAGDGDIHKPVLPEGLFIDQTAALLNQSDLYTSR
jgi:hypothetical protein